MAARPVERRRAQRVDARLGIELRLPRTDGGQELMNLETLNISTSGVYFHSAHFIEPMTKLDMLFRLPVSVKGGGDGVRTAGVRCEGIVVRVVPERPDPSQERYEVAVFFTHFEPDALQHLEDHIELLLTGAS